MKQHVFRPSRVVDGKRVVAKTYSGRYRLPGDLKDRQVALDIPDKQAAKAALAARVKQELLEFHGLVPPSRQTETASSPILPVVGEWLDDLRAKGRKPHHIGVMEKFLNVLCRECGWRRVADVTADSFIRWRISNSTDKSAKTLNEYQGAVRAFFNWLIKTGRMPLNPMASVEKVQEHGKTVRNRRSFTHAEFLRMVAVADPTRSVVYAMAYYTGLRRAELVALFWSDFNLAASVPTVTVHAKDTKNRQAATLPLHSDLKDMLLAHQKALGNPPASSKALEVPKRLRAFERDLKAAGIRKKDERGRILDFHSFRHSCATRLASSGTPLAVAMKIMRHSDPRLTAKVYVDDAALPLAASIEKLPGMTPDHYSLIDSLEPVVSGQKESLPVASDLKGASPQVGFAELLRRVLSHLDALKEMAPAVGIEPTT
jgi:integrase